MSIEQKVREYILENFMFTDDQSALANEDSFLQKGIIDSTGILEVIHFLEDEFNIKVDDEEMIPENLDSVANIIQFVSGKTK
jgi:acyl carrier protein